MAGPLIANVVRAAIAQRARETLMFHSLSKSAALQGRPFNSTDYKKHASNNSYANRFFAQAIRLRPIAPSSNAPGAGMGVVWLITDDSM